MSIDDYLEHKENTGMKEYQVICDLVVETTPDKVSTISQELMNAIIEVVEKHNSFIGGGFSLEEVKDN